VIRTDSTASRRAERLFATHASTLLGYARRRDPSIADDVVAEVFAIAWRRIDDIPHEAELAWLRATADHVMRNHWRARRRSAALVDAIGPTVSDAAAPIEPPVVGEALGALNDRDRALLTMTGWEGLSAPEAAERLGISAGTARNGLVRARRDFAARLAAAGIVVACAIGAVLFVRSAPEREVVTPTVARTAHAIERARTVRQVLHVQAPGESSATPVVVEDDRATGRRTVRLPGGRIAQATRGSRLQLSVRDGAAPGERRADLRRYGRQLAALDVASPDRVAEVLASDPSRAARVVRYGDRLARAVSGVVTVGGRRWSIEVLVDARAPRPLRARVRPSGSPVQWTTIAVRGWQLAGVLPPSPAAAPRPAAAGGRTGSGAARDSRRTPAASGASAAAQSPRSAQNAQRLAAATQRSGTVPYAPYAGRTGAILHIRTALAALAPGSTLRGRHELWVELGGGERARQIRAVSDGEARQRTELQWTPTGLTELRGGSRPVLSVRCRDSAEPAASEWARRTIAAVQQGARERSTLPPGPVIDGVATVTVPGVRWVSSDFPATLYLSASSGEVVGVDEGAGPQPVLSWELIPAGGPADPLEPRIPRDVVAVGSRRC
jgi:RNA polymerase sigma-70 factor (ECF subfamily)